jgi:hypothetical protein
MILASFTVPTGSLESLTWDDAKAQEFQSAAARFHELSHAATDAGAANAESLPSQLAAAQAEYEALRSQLDAARIRPRQVAVVLRWLGVAITITGGVFYYRSLQT